jgi:hypothetical protein
LNAILGTAKISKNNNNEGNSNKVDGEAADQGDLKQTMPLERLIKTSSTKRRSILIDDNG